jgi:cardiolipin synthase (CMP-forming)
MTTANKVTIGRILIIPFFIVSVLYYVNSGHEFYRWFAISCFAVAAVSDAIDGFIARHFNQWSELGTVLDPLADKLLLVTAIILLALRNEPHLPPIPIWLTVTILSRDAILLLGYALVHFVAGGMSVKPHWASKVATVLQMAAVLWTLFKLDGRAQYWICVGAATFTGISGLVYVFAGMRLLARHPSSAAKKQ